MPRRATGVPTLEDVARAAGLSRATAARVLGGYGAASATARARVAAAASRLGYVPDPVARALVTRRGLRLVVAVTGASADVLHDPYVDRIVSAAARAADPHRLGVSSHWLPLSAPSVLPRLAEDSTVQAVLMVDATPQSLEVVPSALHGRVVAIGAGSPTVPSFDVDSPTGITAIFEYLYAAGRRRIVMVTGSHWLPGVERIERIYRGMTRAAGLPVRLLPGDFTAASGRSAALKALDRWPDTDAIFASSDTMALGALTALRSRGVNVPGDIAVAGFDDIPFAALSTPGLTTASHPVECIAAAATAAVLNQTRPPPVTLFASERVPRNSA